MEALPEEFEESKDLVTIGRTFEIVTHQDYTRAGQYRRMAMGFMKEADAKFDGIIEAAKAALEEARALKAEVYDPLKLVKDTLGTKMSSWERAEERKRQESQRKAIREAEERTAREKQEAADLAEIAKEMGDLNLAATITHEAVTMPTPIVIVESEVPKLDNSHHREVWKYEVSDPGTLKAAWMEGRVPETVYVLNEKFVGAEVRNRKLLLGYPGVRVFSEKTLVQKA
jgi:hypothetical protein